MSVNILLFEENLMCLKSFISLLRPKVRIFTSEGFREDSDLVTTAARILTLEDRWSGLTRLAT
jgi:hypothetical protein